MSDNLAAIDCGQTQDRVSKDGREGHTRRSVPNRTLPGLLRTKEGLR